jgi:hypothetical protein
VTETTDATGKDAARAGPRCRRLSPARPTMALSSTAPTRLTDDIGARVLPSECGAPAVARRRGCRTGREVRAVGRPPIAIHYVVSRYVRN